MSEVVIGRCHGGWSRGDGFVEIPSSTTLYLFEDHMATMSAEFADAGILMSTDGLRSMQGKAKYTLGAGKVCYNYTTEALKPDDVVWEGPLDRDIELVDAGLSLADALAKYKGNPVYWFACQYAVEAAEGDIDESEIKRP
jgi:hypothetical protein